MLWLFLGILFFFTIFGVPIVFCLGIANIVMLLVMDIPLMALPAKVIQGADIDRLRAAITRARSSSLSSMSDSLVRRPPGY